MARDISELGADVFDDTPKPKNKISPKKRNYIIGLSITGALLVGVAAATIVLCNTALTDYSNVENVSYYFTPKNLLGEGEESVAVLYRLPSDKTFPSTFRIPSQVLGHKVVGVAPNAFSGHTEIKKVIMANTVEWIGEQAFSGCSNLSSFTWSKKLTDIGVDAFAGTKFYENLIKDDKGLYDTPSGLLIYAGINYFEPNTAIVSNSLNEEQIANIKANYTVSNIKKFSELNVKSLCAGAFKNNDKISYIDLPEALDDIAISTFEGCSNLEGIDSSHSSLKTIAKRGFANCRKLKTLNLPETVTSIGEEAFTGSAITELPNLSNVETIGRGLFTNCTKLESINYTLDTVYQDMFKGCSSLSEITWGDGNENIDNVIDIEQGAFSGTALTEFMVPKNVLAINDFVFENCTSLTKVSLFENTRDELLPVDPDEEEEEELPCVNHEGQPCTELVGVQVFKEAAFRGCTSLSTINMYDYDGDNNLVIHGNDNEFTFPYSVMRCDGSTAGNSNLYTFAETCPTKITFSPNMGHIGGYAFTGITTLTEVKVDQFDLSKMLTIKVGAFKDCTNLTSIDLPHSIRRIENAVFKGCENLANVSVENLNIVAINGEVFYNCPNITSLKLPETVSSIKSDAFKNTYNLEYVVLPAKVTEVLSRAFTSCRNNETDKMPVFVSRTYAAAYTGGKKINFGKNWHDSTVQDYYLLGEGEERIDGVYYWEPDASGNPVII